MCGRSDRLAVNSECWPVKRGIKLEPMMLPLALSSGMYVKYGINTSGYAPIPPGSPHGLDGTIQSGMIMIGNIGMSGGLPKVGTGLGAIGAGDAGGATGVGGGTGIGFVSGTEGFLCLFSHSSSCFRELLTFLR